MNSGLNRRFTEEYIPTLIGNDKDFLSTRISYKLNLKGPSITIQTACSTSMVAIHLARQSLLNEETDMALAGAISVRVPHGAGYFYDGGGVVSSDGHVRAFDAKANGTVFGSGGGILVLKRLADALSDGDTIHAVIRGSAVNNDGSEKAGYTAPSVNGQADAVVEALANAGVDADSISYIEAHGSGTPVGDPIEIAALTKAFRTFTQRSEYCAIGSVKTNVGHLDAAAAVAGMIKTVLALKHRQLPPSLHFNEANPEIDFPSTPFFVNTQLREWTSDGPRRAGVMSTGMGGTNAHIVLEEAPQPPRLTPPPHLLILSAKTETALDQATHRLREFLNRNDSVNMSDVAYTLQVGRKAFPHRRCLVCAGREDAITALDQEDSKRVLSSRTDESRRPMVFLLPGIGDHYVGMAHDLYETWDVFRQEVDRCADPVIYRTSRISLNFSGAGKNPGKLGELDERQLKARVFEVPGAGGFLLTEMAPGLERFFLIGQEVATLPRDLVEKVHFYLARPGERDAIARAGHMRTISEHTYQQRFREILEKLGSSHARQVQPCALSADALAASVKRHRRKGAADWLRALLVAMFSLGFGKVRGPRAARRFTYELSWRLCGSTTYSARGLPGRLFYAES